MDFDLSVRLRIGLRFLEAAPASGLLLYSLAAHVQVAIQQVLCSHRARRKISSHFFSMIGSWHRESLFVFP